MTCCCCSSLRGAAYFCTSVQIFIGLHLFLKEALITVVKGKHQEYFEDSRQQVLYPLLLIYITVFVLLGCVNFLAVQKESGRLIKWTSVFLLILQILLIASHLILAFLVTEERDEKLEKGLSVSSMFHLQRMMINVILSGVYFTILFKYSKALIQGLYVVGTIEDLEEYRDVKIHPKKPKKQEKKRKREVLGAEVEAEVVMNLRPSAPPMTPTPTPNVEEEYDADNDEDVDVVTQKKKY